MCKFYRAGRDMPRPYRAMIFISTRESLPPLGEAIQAVYPLGRFVGVAATGGIYAAPTEYPFYSL